MQFLYHGLQQHPEAWQFSLAEYGRYPELKEELAAAPKAARALLEKALRQASPFLRPGVIPEEAALNLLGSVFTTTVWQSRGWLVLSEGEADRLFLAAIRAVIEFSEAQILESGLQ